MSHSPTTDSCTSTQDDDEVSQSSSTPLSSSRRPFVGLIDGGEHTGDVVVQSEFDTKTLAFRVVVDIFEGSKEPRTCVVQIFATDTTVEDFKLSIQKSEGILIERQRLVFSGEQLENSRHMCFDPNVSAASVGDGYQIRPGDTCTLVVLTEAQVAAAATAVTAAEVPRLSRARSARSARSG